MDKNIGKKLEGRYEITELIGVGGMADVYKAIDLNDGKTVAVKILKKEFTQDEEFLKRFRNECQTVASLAHPNIVKILDVGLTDREMQFIVMEYIDGITLKDYIEQEGRIGWKESVHFIVQVLRALQHAHSKGVVHRDIKPQNIMLFRDGTIKVMDFGIAKFAREEAKPDNGTVIGSVHYISPEQASGRITDEKSDIYSVGIMLYEMLTGVKPFDDEKAVAVARMHISEKAKLPTSINPDIPRGLEQIIMKAIEKKPENRYQSAGEMIKAIEKFKKNPEIVFDYRTEEEQQEEVPVVKEELETVPPSKAKKGRKRKPDPEPEYEDDDDEEDYDDDDEDYEDDDDDDEPEQKSLFVPILTAVTIVVIIVAVFFIASLIKDTFGSGNGIRSEFQMPNLVGMDYNDAKTVYPDIDIKVGSKENTEYAVDTIFEQDIEVGEPVKKGVTVKVKVSLGLKKVKVPDVTNFDYTAATASLEQDGLKYEIKRQADENVQKDYVIKTEPEAFTEVDPGSTIVVYVSDGDVPVEIKMPKFIGKDIDTAKELCIYNQLSYKIQEENSTEPAGTVIGQSYLEGEIVPSKTEITLTVSNGIPPKQQVTINFNIPANAQGRFRFALYYQGEVIGEKSDVNVGYTGTVSVTVEGNGTQEVIAELTNLSTGMATTIGTYKVYFDQNTYDEMSMNMDEKINDAFMAIGGIATQPPATEATTTTEPVYTEETTEPYEETTAPEETTATEETY